MKQIKFTDPPSIIAVGTAVGSVERRNPLGMKFDLYSHDDRFNAKTWEQSEAESQKWALDEAVRKCGGVQPEVLFSGDLINQCTSSAFGLLSYDVPFFGLYGACSTIAEGLILSSVLVSSGACLRAAAVTSSHYCSAERQFRTPLEYGAQRTPTSQRTVTGAAAFIVGRSGAESGQLPKILSVMPGIVTDGGITDQSNMGAAMAPAALRTISDFFESSGTCPSDYDMIVTGDLGAEGHAILCETARINGLDLSEGGCECTDCGLMIYDREAEDVHAGGSGCGCLATVLGAHLLGELKRRKANGGKGRMLAVGTGALMSPLTVMQGLSIPGVAHLVEIACGE